MVAASRSAAPGGPGPYQRPGASRVNSLRNRLILIFMVATLAPLAATIWFTTALLEPTGLLRAAGKVDVLSKSLAQTGRELYQRACEDLKFRALAGETEPRKYEAAGRATWPEDVKSFAEDADKEQFALAGAQGDQVTYLVRHGEDVWVYSAGLGGVELERIKR